MRWCARLACSLALAVPLAAQGRPGGPPRVNATLIAVRVGAGTSALLLVLTPEPGWHLSWRNPGETGLATTVAWNLPAAVRPGREAWPVPRVLRTSVGVQHTLEGATPWLFEFVGAGEAKAAGLVAVTVRYGVCRDVCIPEQQVVQAVLDSAATAPVPLALGVRLAADDGGSASAAIRGGTLCIALPPGAPGEVADVIADRSAELAPAVALRVRGRLATARLPAGARLAQGSGVLLTSALSDGVAIHTRLDLRVPPSGCPGVRSRRR